MGVFIDNKVSHRANRGKEDKRVKALRRKVDILLVPLRENL